MVSPPTRQRPLNPPPSYYSTPLSPPLYDTPSSPHLHATSTSSSTPPPPSSSNSNSPAPTCHDLDAIVPAFPLVDALAGSPNSRHLPHLVASALSCTLTRSSVQLVLAQNVVFVSPPKKDEYGLGLGDYGIEGDDEGKDVSKSFPVAKSRGGRPSRWGWKGSESERAFPFLPESDYHRFYFLRLASTASATSSLLNVNGSKGSPCVWSEVND